MEQARSSMPFPRRPPRLELIFSKGTPVYFVTFNTYRRASLLANPAVHRAMRHFFQRALVEKNVAVGRYVLMPDHVHLFVALPPDGPPLTRWVQMLKTVLGKQLLSSGAAKPHWQEGFFDHVLRNAESYDAKWEYVLMNPVRAALCEQPSEWPYQGEIVQLDHQPL